MNVSEFRLLISVLSRQRAPHELPSLPPMRMRIWGADEDPAAAPHQALIELTPNALARRWLNEAVRAASFEVDGVVPRNRCVFSCSDGTVQESGCANDPQDIQNCMDAVKGRCVSGTITTISFGPGTLRKRPTSA